MLYKSAIASFVLMSITATVACTGDAATEPESFSPSEVAAGVVKASEAVIRKELEAAAQGLTYASESDEPYTYVHYAPKKSETLRIAGSIVGQKFSGLEGTQDDKGRELRDQKFERRDFASFLADDPEDPEIDPDLAAQFAKFAKVKAVMSKYLTNLKVFRYGTKNRKSGLVKGPSVQIFIVGKSASGAIIGLRTVSIET
jgi:hypothetical protein